VSESPRRVYFVAIAGTGMGSLAGLLKARGLLVSGSDARLYPPMSTALERWGIPVHEGFRAEQVIAARPDLVVIGNAVRAENPEALAVLEEGIPHLSFPDALYRLAIEGKHSVVVAGTHGKTTTTALTAKLLEAAGRDPSLLVGGWSLDFDGSFRDGRGTHFVVEGDEYDTAFFDKTPKFLHYGARSCVLTSVEFDHADIYRDLEHVKQAFRALVARLPADGLLVAATNHPGVRDVVAGARCRVVGYGLGPEGDPEWRAEGVRAEAGGTRFELWCDGERVAETMLPLFGRFNVENALGAVAAAAGLGVPVERAASALAGFRGVKRRQELRGEARGVAVVDDFAHHPTAVAGSIASLRARYPGRRLLAVFEPRTNTSRRAIFQRAYAEAFDAADGVVVAVVPDTPIYSATGEVAERFSSPRLAEDIRARGIPALAIDGVDAIVDHLARETRPGDVVLVMSNGDFGNVWGRLLDALRA
jgi:UDP-N-acetylmuramate: L-alanyl-gamma-D-glutamyl-meso-diaminopimelate ligase